MDSLDKSKYTVHSDLPGKEAAGGGTIPPEICVTPLKPDIVILNKKEMHIFELTCSPERNIEERHLCTFFHRYHIFQNFHHSIRSEQQRLHITKEPISLALPAQAVHTWDKVEHIYEEHLHTEHLLQLPYMAL